MGKGWVIIHRKLWDNKILKNETFSEREAWIWLIAQASHKESQICFDNDVITIQRGQLIRSIRKLSKTFSWGTRKCRNFLSRLEKAAQIKLYSKPNKYTQITICNYDRYQKPGHTQSTTDEHTNEITPENTRRTSDSRYTNNNMNYITNSNKEGLSKYDKFK